MTSLDIATKASTHMANHFRAVGFEVLSETDWEATLDRTANEGGEFVFDGGRILCWSPADESLQGDDSPTGAGTGPQIWVLVDDDWNFKGASPHFSGKSSISIRAVNWFPDAEFWEGSVYAWVNPLANKDEENGAEGEYPFLLQLPDFYHVSRTLPLPHGGKAQVTAFAHELDFFATEEEYAASQSGETKLASNFFIPTGLFAPEGEEPQPYAMFAGKIVEYNRLTNPASDLEFHHFMVETLGGVYDVVAEQELVTTAPAIGTIVSGSFWMSGQIIE
jgi:hypothetical protein